MRLRSGPQGVSAPNFVYIFEHSSEQKGPPERRLFRNGDRVVSELPTILVIEDEIFQQALVEEALSEAGFELAITASGEEAVTLLSGNKGKYRALVTDISLLGRFDGWEVAKRAREIDPVFPVVYMTGSAAEQWNSHGVPNSILLSKPFAPAQLVTAVSSLLNSATPTAQPPSPDQGSAD
jgi:DNA-binding response OmpR family regulator